MNFRLTLTIMAASACVTFANPRDSCDYDGATVNCAHQHLSAIPLSSEHNNKATRLYLAHNDIPAVPAEAFNSFPKATAIDLSHNHVTSLDAYAFTDLRHLEELRLDNNSIRDIDDVLESIAQLRKLTLSQNPLRLTSDTRLPDSLQFIDLSRCKLKYLPPEMFQSLTELVTLNLAHNNLTQLPVGFFEHLPKLSRVYLHGNPWSCDVTDVLGNKHDVIADIGLLRCATSDGKTHKVKWRTTHAPETRPSAPTQKRPPMVPRQNVANTNKSLPYVRRDSKDETPVDTDADSVYMIAFVSLMATLTTVVLVFATFKVIRFVQQHQATRRRLARDDDDVETNAPIVTSTQPEAD